MFVVSILINVGMWFERFVIILTLTRDFLPSSWGWYWPTKWDFAILIGSFGLFFTLFLLFIRFLPMISMAEVKNVLPQADPHHARYSREIGAIGGGDSMSQATPKIAGILAEFESPAALMHAAEEDARCRIQSI